MNIRTRLRRPTNTFLQRTRRRNVRFALCFLLVALAGLAAHEAATNTAATTVAASTPAAPTATTLSGPLAPAPGVPGMVAAIDPETGLLTAPTPEQMRALLGSVDTPRKTAGVEIVQRPDGTVIGTLDASFLSYSVAHIDAAGHLRSDCVHGDHGRDAALRSATRPTTPAAAPEQ